jgi:substrate import-associated zinc metallohydrolase lipoprotein
MQTHDIDQLNEYIFKTMHHEFSHILHQKKTYPKEFEQISAADYNPDGWQYTKDYEAWQMGFASPYGGSQAREDFVEIIANYIVKSDAQLENMLNVAGQDGKKGRAILIQKIGICRDWLADKWQLDLDALRAEVQKRQNNMDWDMIMSLGFLHQQK